MQEKMEIYKIYPANFELFSNKIIFPICPAKVISNSIFSWSKINLLTFYCFGEVSWIWALQNTQKIRK